MCLYDCLHAALKDAWAALLFVLMLIFHRGTTIKVGSKTIHTRDFLNIRDRDETGHRTGEYKIGIITMYNANVVSMEDLIQMKQADSARKK